MNIDINQTVSYEVKSVKIPRIVFLKDSKGNLNIAAPYQWLDATDKVVRTGNNFYPHAQLVTLFAAQGQDYNVLSGLLKQLFPAEGTSHNLAVNLDVNNTTGTMGYSGVVGGNPQWISTSYDQSQLETLLNSVGLSISVIHQMTQAATMQVFA